MKALCWHGKEDIRCDTVPDPKIENPRDAIIKVTSCAICGSDLHLMGGFVPHMKSGDVLGHETMGEVVEVGSAAQSKLKVGDRVVVPFTISCGECRMCRMGNWSCCEVSNPAGKEQAKEMGYPTSDSHAYGGFAGGQAQYLRVRYADVGPIKVPAGLSDEQVLFLSDIFPTGYHAAVNCDIQPGQTVAIFGCGPVGLFAIKSAFLLGAGRVIAVDAVPERMALARQSGADVINFTEVDEDGNYIAIDCNPSRLGYCYDAFHETIDLLDHCKVIARSFTELMNRAAEAGDNACWLGDKFDTYGYANELGSHGADF